VTAYDSVERRGFRPRRVGTRLSPDYLRTVFRTTVASDGWRLIDDGNPMVAQSSPAAGRRQQIAMHLDPVTHGTDVRIAVVRYSRTAIGSTTKARTLRSRINAFLKEVQQADQTADIAG
jgi:Flp pilus assembly CpaF family ATPase